VTVAEFITWLQTQDQEAKVQVVRHESGVGYYCQGGTASIVDFSLDPHCFLYDYIDMRGNPHVTPDKPYYNERTLLIGKIGD